MLIKDKRKGREIRHLRVRQRIRGSMARPRLSVFRGLRHIYAQLIDDETGRTLVAASSLSPEFSARLKNGGNVTAARLVGELVAQKAKAVGIERAVFDRGGYRYHGRVKAVADAARAAGLQL